MITVPDVTAGVSTGAEEIIEARLQQLLDGATGKNRVAVLIMLEEITARRLDRIAYCMSSNGYRTECERGLAETRLSHARFDWLLADMATSAPAPAPAAGSNGAGEMRNAE